MDDDVSWGSKTVTFLKGLRGWWTSRRGKLFAEEVGELWVNPRFHAPPKPLDSVDCWEVVPFNYDEMVCGLQSLKVSQTNIAPQTKV